MSTDELVAVTGEDRLLFAELEGLAGPAMESVLRGEYDDHPDLERLARHRRAGMIEGMRRAKAIVEREAFTNMEGLPFPVAREIKNRVIRAASAIATAIAEAE